MPLQPGKKRRPRKFASGPGASSSRHSTETPSGRPCGFFAVSLWSLFGFFISLCLLLTYRLGLRARSLRGAPQPFDADAWQLQREPGHSEDRALGAAPSPDASALGALEAELRAAPGAGQGPSLQSPAVPAAVASRLPPPLPPAPGPGARPAVPVPGLPPVAPQAPQVAVGPAQVVAAGVALPQASAPQLARTPPVVDSRKSCTLEMGYANSQINGGTDQQHILRPEDCRDLCIASVECSCYSWKQDGFCRIGFSGTCNYIGSRDDQSWRFGHCALGLAGDSSPLATAAPVEPPDWLDVYRRHFGHSISRSVHVFYYGWYGSMDFDKSWVHWNHQFLTHWDRNIAPRYPSGKHDPDRGDIASAFWPSLGPYSSRDPVVIQAHMSQMRKAAIGVLVFSWYPSGMRDDNGFWGSEEVLKPLLEEAEKHDIEVAIHIEPYKGRTPETVRNDIDFIIKNYGQHKALHRRVASGAHRQLLHEPHKSRALPVIYVYDSYKNPAVEWRNVLRPGPLSIRNTDLDAIVFCLWVQREHEAYLSEGGFDGAYTYFAADGSSYGSKSSNWPAMAAAAERHGALFVPSVGPGYNDLKVRPWNQAATRSREDGRYYERMAQAAAALAPPILSLTSWNEWHEGTNLEPAEPKAHSAGVYEDYGTGGPEAYILRTRDAVGQLARKQAQIPVLFVTHARAQYLRRALEAALKHRPHPEVFPLIATQDGTDAAVSNLVEDQIRRGHVLKHLTFQAPPTAKTGYQRLCAHYRWALDQLFEVMGYQQAIILEEDIEVSPDFFSYFAATLPLLRADPELFCVSAWNDNGRPQVASDAQALYRTDFFPGLGWMLLRTLWFEVRNGWPPAYWDEYMRRKDVRKERHCIRPEVSRTHTFGEVGVSKGQFYKTHLAQNRLNTQNVDWSAMDLQHISTAGHFDEHLSQLVSEAQLVTLEWLQAHRPDGQQSFAVKYEDSRWKVYATYFGLMDDAKEGIRRGTYRGVLPFTWQNSRIYLVRDWPLTK